MSVKARSKALDELSYRANKVWFYQSGSCKHVEFIPDDSVHGELYLLLLTLDTPARRDRANLLAKKLGFKSYYNKLSSDISLIRCDSQGLIVEWFT